MDYATQLWLFFALVFGIVVLPGMDMAFVLGSALAGGRRTGLAAVAGLVVAGACHVVVGTLGVSALLAVVPGAMQAMLLLGSAYVAWIGWSLLRSREGFGAEVIGKDPEQRRRTRWATFRQAALTNLLNPKAYMFMLAVFPQFLRPEFGSIGRQAFVLGLIIALAQVGVYGLLALGAGGARGWLAARPGAGLAVNRGVGALLVAVAVATCIGGLRGL